MTSFLPTSKPNAGHALEANGLCVLFSEKDIKVGESVEVSPTYSIAGNHSQLREVKILSKQKAFKGEEFLYVVVGTKYEAVCTNF